MLPRRVVAALTSGALYGERATVSRWTCCVACQLGRLQPARSSSSASSKRWKSRQQGDFFTKEARLQGLKSRAAFKLLEINEKYKILKKGQTVVDLGYAPGSWTEVAVNRTAPNGRVLGIDIIPAKPPKGASAIQGNFLSPAVQEEVKRFLRDPNRGRPRQQRFFADDDGDSDGDGIVATAGAERLTDEELEERGLTEEELELTERGYIDMERHASADDAGHGAAATAATAAAASGRGAARWSSRQRTAAVAAAEDEAEGRTVDVVLSDMSEPWPQNVGPWNRSLSEPYYRMMNTSGINFRDHAGSMDLCMAALEFCFDTLRTGGHFVCKFYQGAEDRAFETKLRRLFRTVHRDKPEASRWMSREAYFVALKREKVSRAEVFRD